MLGGSEEEDREESWRVLVRPSLKLLGTCLELRDTNLKPFNVGLHGCSQPLGSPWQIYAKV